MTPPARALVLAATLLLAACGSDDNAGTDASALRWYETCGDPVCREGDAGAPSGSARCTTEKAGTACTAKGAMCDPAKGCGVLLRCADSDPRTQPGGCPIARAIEKTRP
jgi:hypothetical protein